MIIYINEITYITDYYNIDDILIIESDALVNISGIDRKLVEHQEFDIFKSVDHAALAWSLKYWKESNNVGEYAAWIYKGSDGGYFFGDYNTINNKTSGRAPKKLDGYEVAAGIHTHPNVFLHNGDRFSDTDIRTSYYNGMIPVYIASGSGKLRATETRIDGNILYKENERTVYSGLKY